MKKLLLILLFSFFGSFPEATDYYGTLTMNPNTTKEYSLENIRVTLLPDNENNKATLVLHRVKFSRMMPVRVNVRIPDVTTSFSNGKLALSGNGIVPVNGANEHLERMVTNLGGSAVECQLSFKMKMGGIPMVYKGRSH